jgi:hypothetical protein
MFFFLLVGVIPALPLISKFSDLFSKKFILKIYFSK